MNASHCPLCHTELEVRDVTPCMECGHTEMELEHLAEGKHTFAEFRVFGDLTLTLCNICMVDFGSSDPAYFGLPRGARIGYELLQFLRDVEPGLGKDKCCPSCLRRLAFLEFVAKSRDLHRHEDQ